VHVKRSLGKNESSGIRDTSVLDTGETKVGSIVANVVSNTLRPPALGGNINSTGVLEKTTSIDKRLGSLGNGLGSTERVDGVGKSINRVGVVEGLGTKSLVESL